MQTYTDLAIENAEMLNAEYDMEGIKIEERGNEQSHMKVIRVEILNETGAKKLGRRQGTYITLEALELAQKDESYHEALSEEIRRQIQRILPGIEKKKCFVVGVGNRNMVADALGPMVIDHLLMNRHLKKEDETSSGCISGIAPGVMAQTGIETQEIVKGIIAQTQPECLLVVDALATGSIKRLNKTIQITDTGIEPGAGIGNQRYGINGETMGIPVIAIGIPTVIHARSILNEIDEGWDSIYMTAKNMDELVLSMSYTLSEAINQLFHWKA